MKFSLSNAPSAVGHGAENQVGNNLHGPRSARIAVVGAVLVATTTLSGCGWFIFGKYEAPALPTEQTTRVTFQNDYSSTAHLLIAETPGNCESADKRIGWQPNGMMPYREAATFAVPRGEPVRIDIYDQGENGATWWHCFVPNVYTFDRAEVTLRFVRAPGGCKVEMSDAGGEPITQKVEKFDKEKCFPTQQPISSRTN